MQENKPIAFASKALSSAESRYANIERELLAVVYGCEKFHTYLYGRQFVIESDHRPLEQIHKKNLDKAPPRLQRMLLRLQPYDCIIQYKPGKEMVTADTLSRLSPIDRNEISGMQVQIHQLVEWNNNSWYIVIADYYSKFPFVKKLTNLTASSVVNVVRSIFSEQGIPEVMICDNGTQFTSAEFQDLSTRYGFRVVTSSPYYPKEHGFIKRQVQTVKKILIKC